MIGKSAPIVYQLVKIASRLAEVLVDVSRVVDVRLTSKLLAEVHQYEGYK